MEDLYFHSVIGYCERVGNGILTEPINLFSNLSFFLSAVLIFRMLKNSKKLSIGYWILFGLVVLIGVGSSLWHSFRTPFTHALDAVPIYLFIVIFLYLLLKNLTASRMLSLVGVLIFFLLQIIASIFFATLLNGSI